MKNLLEAIQSRSRKQTSFAYGILTADKYVSTIEQLIGPDACNRMASKGRGSFSDMMQKAAKTLVYSNPEMALEQALEEKRLVQPLDGIELPKNTLMAFKHVLTSSQEDRDGDTLHSDGASPDPNMLLLWQHVHTMPIGKFLTTFDKSNHKLVVGSCIVDMNDLCHDAAVMIDNKMGRFSHGFRALEFTETKARNGHPGGFDVTKFEIMEESLVSVPANVDAQTEEVLLSLVEGGKLTSPIMKQVGSGIRSRRNIIVPGVSIKYRERRGDIQKELLCHSLSDLKTAAEAGLIGSIQDENKSRNRTKTGTEDNPSTSKEANDDADQGNRSKDSNDQKVKSLWGAIPGSWQAIQGELQEQMKPYLSLSGIALGEHDGCYISAMFDDHVLVNVTQTNMESTYEIDWQMNGDSPELTGAPTEVEISISTQTLTEAGKSVGMVLAKPYANEHAARINDPDKYAKIRRQNDKFGDGIHALWGVLDNGKTEVQAIRFDKGQFTAAEAKQWLKDNDYKPMEFEEAAAKSGKQLVTKGVTAQLNIWVDDGGNITTDALPGKSIETLEGQKLGRVLSKANESAIKDAMGCHEEVMKLGPEHASRSTKALVKEAHGHLEGVMNSLGSETNTEVEVKEAMAVFLTKATNAQHKQMVKALEAIEQSNQLDPVTKEYLSLTGKSS